MKTKKQAPKAHKKIIRQKNIIITTAIILLAIIGYVWHGAFLQILLRQKTIGEGLPVYSVEQTNHTDAYGWFTDYPKLDKPAFDTVIAKYINNSKGVFLGHVNFDDHGSYPKDDLTISYKLAAHTATTVRVVLMENRVINGNQTSWARQISYDDASGSVTDESASPVAIPASNQIAAGDVPIADSNGPDCSVKKCLALAFVGGPSYVTPQLLDVLKQNHAKATFFELGSQIARYADAAKRTVREGNIIGNGTYDYRNLMAMSQDEAVKRLSASAEAIKVVTGVNPGITIAPYGAATDEFANSTKQVIIKPTTEETSWQAGSSNALYQSILADAKTGIIMQSYDTDQVTADAFKIAIPKLIQEGYTLVTVPQLLGFTQDSPSGLYQANE